MDLLVYSAGDVTGGGPVVYKSGQAFRREANDLAELFAGKQMIWFPLDEWNGPGEHRPKEYQFPTDGALMTPGAPAEQSDIEIVKMVKKRRLEQH